LRLRAVESRSASWAFSRTMAGAVSSAIQATRSFAVTLRFFGLTNWSGSVHERYCSISGMRQSWVAFSRRSADRASVFARSARSSFSERTCGAAGAGVSAEAVANTVIAARPATSAERRKSIGDRSMGSAAILPHAAPDASKACADVGPTRQRNFTAWSICAPAQRVHR
jgi:hypothetical protein